MIEGMLIGLTAVFDLKPVDGDRRLPDRHLHRHAARPWAHVDHRDHDPGGDHARRSLRALILLAGVYYGAIFGGSTSSILLNAPGVAGTVASSFDGYPMARSGQAGKALTIAAIASFAGGTIGAVLLMIFAPAVNVALLFHSAEYFALMVVGLSAIAAFAGTGKWPRR